MTEMLHFVGMRPAGHHKCVAALNEVFGLSCCCLEHLLPRKPQQLVTWLAMLQGFCRRRYQDMLTPPVVARLSSDF
ncbi:hypothetical protein CBM2626_A40330 [Cupriavidus taiwanensis]|nr:hypothetical protein CBM2626_A40330 [Cupriavidus taiwanensis]